MFSQIQRLCAPLLVRRQSDVRSTVASKKCRGFLWPNVCIKRYFIRSCRSGITTILGANGAGKTTTLRAISGLVRTAGEISFAGQRIDGLATEKIAALGIAHVPDGRGTLVNLTVQENLRVGAYLQRDTQQIELDFERIYGYFPPLA